MAYPSARPSRLAASWTFCLLAAIAGGGCGNAAYRGADLSARSFNEDPGLQNTYVGFDLNFALESDSPHVPPRPSPAFVGGGTVSQADIR